jgi:glycerol-3-phosphate acyltransferase PlsY
VFFDGLLVQAISLSVIIGHIFPIFFKFKGGKGAATNLGIICSISIILAIIGMIIFLTIFFTTKYVSLASMTSPFLIAPFTFLPYFNG